MSNNRRPLIERKSWAGWFHDDVTDKREPKSHPFGFNPIKPTKETNNHG